jgi:ABC-type Zn uptake system ZnuABC Zn-binding protein ZnuA
VFFVALILVLAGCGRAATPEPTVSFRPLQVVATTTLVGDVVSAVGGDAVALTVLMPPGADPHSFQPTPQDVARLSQADLVFINGLGLEEGLLPVIEGAVAAARIVAVSEGVPVLSGVDEHGHEDQEEHAADDEHDGSTPPSGSGDTHEHLVDPHTWMDPHNVMVWTRVIAEALARADPAHRSDYEARAQAYIAELEALDAWIRQEVATIPPEKRLLVTDHLVFGYFGRRYGFEQIGAVLPGFSTVAEPSAQELAALEEAIRGRGVPAIFVGTTVSPRLAERVARDTGTRLLTIYTGSLSGPEGPAPTYLEFMRYNVRTIVAGLRQEP